MQTREQVRELIVLSKLEKQIMHFSESVRLYNYGYTKQDIVQEAHLKALEIIRKYRDKNMREIISICSTSIKNHFRNLIRLNKSDIRNVELVDITELHHLPDSGMQQSMYYELAVSRIIEIIDDNEERDIVQMIFNPSKKFVRFLHRRARSKNKDVVRCNIAALAEYFGMHSNVLGARLCTIRERTCSSALNRLQAFRQTIQD